MYIIDKSWELAAENLAYEYCLMNEVKLRKNHNSILYLCQNKDSVVIGRNQNPYKECDMNFILQNKIELVRRITGGGAVYHDLGNLNYSFICNDEDYDRNKVFNCIILALNSLGVSCNLSGRNDILANSVKISGNAFYSADKVVLHHGTIMVNVDINRMNYCLTPCKAKLNSKGVLSVKGRVGNLNDINKQLDIFQIKKAISSQFSCLVDEIDYDINIDKDLFYNMTNKFTSSEWILGNYPLNYETISGQFAWGNISLGFILDNDKIEQCYIESDSLYPEDINELESWLKGLDLVRISENNIECAIEKTIFCDVVNLIREKLIYL